MQDDAAGSPATPPTQGTDGFLAQANRRGVLRVGASYAVIGWLLLQIADVVFEPLGAPPWAMPALIVAVALGFPVALGLAWFYELGDHGLRRDTAPADATRPAVHGLRRYADVLVIGVLLVTVAVLLVRQSDLGRPRPPANPAIAVLPFENLSGDPEQDYFSDGLAEEMLDRLGRVPGLRVIARSSSFGFKGRDVDVRTIAERLGVTTVLEGSVRRDGKRLRLSARLIDGVSGQQAWSGSYDRELNDIFAVQAELAAAVVEAIIPAARGAMTEANPTPTSDLDAYELYLLAKTQLALRTPESVRRSMDLAERAVRLDPKFAQAQAQLARSLLFMRLLNATAPDADPAAWMRRAQSAIHAALALDPDLSDAHGAYANLLRDTGRPGADEHYRRALELNPNNATSWHDYAVYLANVEKRYDEADRARTRALELDPRQPVTWANQLNAARKEGRQRYEAEFARAMRAVGDMPGARNWLTVEIWARDRADYRRQFDKLLRQHGDDVDVLDGLVFNGAILGGYPAAILGAGVAKQRLHAPQSAPFWANRFRAWLTVDPERAAAALPEDGPGPFGVDFAIVRLMLLSETTGRIEAWERLDGILGELEERVDGQQSLQPGVASIAAFWLTVQDRHAEAARWLELAGEVPDERMPTLLGYDKAYGLMEAATLRILRGTGRKADADRLAQEWLAARRAARAAPEPSCHPADPSGTPVRDASLFASEGLREEAVAALRHAMRCSDIPFGFWPRLPWFRALEGYPPYDELLREYQQRIEEVRGQLLELEAAG